MDKAIEKLLDLLIDSEIVKSLENNKLFSKFVEILKDKKFMIHITKYIIFGILTTIISIGSLWLLVSFTTLNENLCNFISIILGILSAYILNREYVFESKETNIFKEFSKFVMSRIISSVFDMVTFFVFATCLSLNEMIVKIVISVVVVILNYVLSKLMVFNKKDLT